MDGLIIRRRMMPTLKDVEPSQIWVLGYGVYVASDVVQYINTSAARAIILADRGDHCVPILKNNKPVPSDYYPIKLPENTTKITAAIVDGSNVYYKIYALSYNPSTEKWTQLAQVGFTNTAQLNVPSGTTHWMAAIRLGSAGTGTVKESDTKNIQFNIY